MGEVIQIEECIIIDNNTKIYTEMISKATYRWDNHESLVEYLQEMHSFYNISIEGFRGYVKNRLAENIEIIDSLFPNIIYTVQLYLSGKIQAAYRSMTEAYESINELLNRKSDRVLTTGLKFGFRARIIERDRPPLTSRKDIFHIPFEQRHLVGSHRYSIQGVPSIYLSSSILGCYLELGSPDLDELWVSIFSFIHEKDKKDTRFARLIDLTFADDRHHIPQHWSRIQNDECGYYSETEALIDDILLWPLILACSVVCRYSNASLKQEYIIPQMIYQLSNESHQFSGVRYYSTRWAGIETDRLRNAMINYAGYDYPIRTP